MEPIVKEPQVVTLSLYAEPKHQVFINCPFDDEYLKLLFEPMVFTIQACGFMSRCALEASLENDRFKRIQDLIELCPVSIHDLSRNLVGEDPRFNMPLELGLFIGCKRYGGGDNASKTYLVLDREKYQYQKYISDINGQDPRIHANNPGEVIKHIRNWLSNYYAVIYSGDVLKIPSAKQLFGLYQDFSLKKAEFCSRPEFNFDPEELTFNEQREIITKWWIEWQQGYRIMQAAMQSKQQALEIIAVIEVEKDEQNQPE